jgi:hypothetical protein
VRSIPWRVSLAAAALALVACLTTVVVARFVPGGHPPLSVYVVIIAVPLAWLLSLAGIVFAIASRKSVARSHYLVALMGNLVTLVLGCAIWFFFPMLVA